MAVQGNNGRITAKTATSGSSVSATQVKESSSVPVRENQDDFVPVSSIKTKKTEAKSTLQEELSKPFKTGIYGQDGEGRKTEVIMLPDRGISYTLRSLVAEEITGLASGKGKEGSEIEKDKEKIHFTPDEKFMLDLGMIGLSAIRKAWDEEIVIRDAENKFLVCHLGDILKIAREIDRKILTVYRNKWRLEELSSLGTLNRDSSSDESFSESDEAVD